MDHLNLACLKAGELPAWQHLALVLAPKIRGAIEHVLGTTTSPDAPDIESNVFSWLVSKVNESAFGDMQHMEARAIIKARSLAIDYLRHESKSPITHVGAEGIDLDKAASRDPNPAEQMQEHEEIELADLLINLINALDSKQGAVLKCLFLEEKTQQETADALGIPIGSVGVYRSRGLEKMKKEIKRHPHLKETLTLKYPTLQLTLEIAILVLLIK